MPVLCTWFGKGASTCSMSRPSEPDTSLTLTPIGLVRSPHSERRDAPRQANLEPDTRGRIELFPNRGFENALADIETWSHLWIVFWFHLNSGWRPMVRPPRGSRRRGVFSTRSPHRPNPIGLSAVALERREGLVLHVKELDLLDGTPVLDIKPYVPYSDCLTMAKDGWLTEDRGEVFDVGFEMLAEGQLYALGERGRELRATLEQTLALGPRQPHYRRIKKLDGELYQIAVKAWRAHFRCEHGRVSVVRIVSGYRREELQFNDAPELDAHRSLMAIFLETDKQ
jgi:tRNA (adenine37-N6)-methyltransferase